MIPQKDLQKEMNEEFELITVTIGTLRSDDGGCLRRRAEVGNICLRISGSRRVRFPALAVLSETSKRSVCRLV